MLGLQAAFEAMLLICLAALGRWKPTVGLVVFKCLGRQWRAISQRPYLSIIVPSIISAVITIGMVTWVGPPQPYSNDELSYLVAAETFVNGRLTNAPHQLAHHFECRNSFLIHRPTYQSKYPPGQGLCLALGWTAGHAIFGVCGSLALAVGAVAWMLRGWLPSRWAFVGGMLAALHPWMLTWWGHSYWGGAVAMLGGALVFGALPRVLRSYRVGDVIVMAIGISILANSRPFEGVLAIIPASVLLVWKLFQNHSLSLTSRLCRLALPFALIGSITSVGIGYYNYRVTGSAFLMPYRVWHLKYHPGKSFSSFLIGTLPSDANEGNPTLQNRKERTPSLRRLHQHSSLALALPLERTHHMKRQLLRLWSFYLRILLLLPFSLLLFRMTGRGSHFAVLTCSVVLGALLAQPRDVFPHYFAPAASLLFLILVNGIRHLRQLRWDGRKSGRFVARGLIVCYALATAVFIPCWLQTRDLHTERAEFRQRLESDGDLHLVVVRRDFRYPVQVEWVANRADIDASSVVWALDLGPHRNRELLDYFRGRQLWYVDQAHGRPRRLSADELLEMPPQGEESGVNTHSIMRERDNL